MPDFQYAVLISSIPRILAFKKFEWENAVEAHHVSYLLARHIIDFIADVKDFMRDYLAISTTTPTIDDLQVCFLAKRILPEVRIVAKGAHFLKFSEKIMERFGDLDMIIRGEAEMTFREVIQGKKAGRSGV